MFLYLYIKIVNNTYYIIKLIIDIQDLFLNEIMYYIRIGICKTFFFFHRTIEKLIVLFVIDENFIFHG